VLRKHKDNTTVAIEILKSFYVKEKRLMKLKVRWWNIGKCHAPWSMLLEQRIEIPIDLWRDWEHYHWPSLEEIVE
jgi:hypothetical protein